MKLDDAINEDGTVDQAKLASMTEVQKAQLIQLTVIRSHYEVWSRVKARMDWIAERLRDQAVGREDMAAELEKEAACIRETLNELGMAADNLLKPEVSGG